MPPPRRSLTKGNRLTRKVTSRSPILSWQLMGEKGAIGLYFPRRSLPRQCRGAAACMGHASTKNRGNTRPARPPPPVELPLQPPLPLGPVNRPEGGGIKAWTSALSWLLCCRRRRRINWQLRQPAIIIWWHSTLRQHRPVQQAAGRTPNLQLPNSASSRSAWAQLP
jgi:hypothetical protein